MALEKLQENPAVRKYLGIDDFNTLKSQEEAVILISEYRSASLQYYLALLLSNNIFYHVQIIY